MRRMGTRLIGGFLLPNGESVCIVCREIINDRFFYNDLSFYKTRIAKVSPNTFDADTPSIRAFFWGKQLDSSYSLYDVRPV